MAVVRAATHEGFRSARHHVWPSTREDLRSEAP